jgi:hypothetical protein
MDIELVYISKCGRYICVYTDKFTSYYISTNKPGRISYSNLEASWTCLGEL